MDAYIHNIRARRKLIRANCTKGASVTQSNHPSSGSTPKRSSADLSKVFIYYCFSLLSMEVVKKNKAAQISESRTVIVNGCCSLVEDAFSDHFGPLALDSVPLPSRCDDVPQPWFLATMEESYAAYLGNNSGSSITYDTEIDWDKVPPTLHPEGGELAGYRSTNKRQQIDAMMGEILSTVDTLSSDGNTVHVVDIGAGSGHVGLLVAWMRPDTCRVTLLERKEYCCRRAEARSREAELSNVEVANTTLHAFCDYKEGGDEGGGGTLGPNAIQFDLAISLHSCGVLTDGALEVCAQQRAAFCLCPCCYGQTSANDVLRPHMPRSLALNSLHCAPLPKEWGALKLRVKNKLSKGKFAPKPFHVVARSADCTSPVDGEKSFVESRNFAVAKRCMQLVDADRICWMAEHGYIGKVGSLKPLDVTPKNDLIFGIPLERISTRKKTAVATMLPVQLIALAASAEENRNAEAGEKKEERERIREGQQKWSQQFQACIKTSGSDQS